ncbi:MAG TPA: hypothetical protein VK633_03655, partial [Verrucomicrobiae bacterium]|nr:hypothetical protein [Verrucomicrobiae bacterium]
AGDDQRSAESKVNELYLMTYSREAQPPELEAALKYLNSPEKSKDAKAQRAAYEDLIWALVNTKEFLFNH